MKLNYNAKWTEKILQVVFSNTALLYIHKIYWKKKIKYSYVVP